VATVLDLLGKLELVVVGLLVHGISVDLSDGIGGEVALSTGDPVLLGQVLSVDDLSLRLSGPEDTDETGVTVVGGTDVPARVSVTPEAEGELVTGGGSSHGGVGSNLTGLALVVTACELSGESVGVVGGLGDPVSVPDLVTGETLAGLLAVRLLVDAHDE
jgi:hypothetical protein